MSIRWKLAIIFMASVFFVMVVTGTFIVMSLRIAEENEQAAALAEQGQRIQNEVIFWAFANRGLDFDGGSDAFEDLFLEPFGELVTGRIPGDMEAFIISGETRRTIATTADNSTGFYTFLSQQAVIAALTGEQAFSPPTRRHLNHLNERIYFFEFAMPVFLEGTGSNEPPDFVIYMRASAEEFNRRLGDTVRTIALSAVLALAGASVLSIVFAGSLTQNLLRLNKRISDYKVGSAIEPIDIGNVKDEIGQLALSFNNMSRDLNAGMSIITNEKNKMEIIMYNMTDGVLAYNDEGVLIHSNYASEELLALGSIEKLTMKELLGRIGVEFPEGKSMTNLEDTIINLGEKYINLNFNPYTDEDGRTQGIIIVLQDITKHMLLDNMRKEFVANVSHEIRTPLTTIKSYVETLLDGAGDDDNLRKDFLTVVNNEADRMAAIIKDLLELSRFDNKRMEFDFQLADLVALVENNVRGHRIFGEKNNKEINFSTEIASAFVRMDPERVNQVIDNIITNSFRYSGDSARIDVEIHESGLFFMVYISDDGIGIPKEDSRMIFERFYRVDKARSRELGGTGLGLSIAKEIMEAHGGRINVSSELGVGTTMILRFPKEASIGGDRA